MIIVLPPASLTRIMQEIAAAAHSCTDTAGERVRLSTMAPDQLRTAALVAMTVATGHVVHPGDESIRIKRPKPARGAVLVEED